MVDIAILPEAGKDRSWLRDQAWKGIRSKDRKITDCDGAQKAELVISPAKGLYAVGPL